MKFTESINPDWSYYYLNYEALRNMLQDGLRKAPKKITSSEMNDGKLNYTHYVSLFDERFFKVCDQELDKINLFCREKVHECVEKFLELKSDAELLMTSNREENYREGGDQLLHFWSRKRSSVNEETLEVSFKKFYALLLSLATYQELNYSGFKKILQKHDKQFSSTTGTYMKNMKLDLSYFHLVKDIKKLLQETEILVAGIYDRGSRPRAVKRLAVAPPEQLIGPWTGFKLGLMAGTCLVLTAVIFVSGITEGVLRLTIRLYRGPFTLMFYIFLIGINFHAWAQKGINHVHIFDLDPAHHMMPHQFWNIAAIFGLLWALSIVTFVNEKHILPAFTSPFILLVLQAMFLFNPFPFGYFSARKWLFKHLFRIVTAPFHRVSFADFWMCDQFSSLISLVLDYMYTFCFFWNWAMFHTTSIEDSCMCLPKAGSNARPSMHCFNNDTNAANSLFTSSLYICPCDSPSSYWRSAIRALPAFLRILQCLRRYYDAHLVCPHLVNGLKYFFSLSSTTLSALYGHKVAIPGWPNGMLYCVICVSFTSSVFSYIWDVKMDWGLANIRSKHRFIRNDLLYNNIWYYYIAAVGDLFLRFSWAASMTLTSMNYVAADIMLTITTPVEIFRRFGWNLFRLENEQINNNKAQLAAAQAVAFSGSVQSFGMTEEQQMLDVLRIMDHEDGPPVKRRTGGGLIGRSDLGASFTSFEFDKSSRSELFTKVHPSTSQMGFVDNLSDISSLMNIQDPPKSWTTKIRDIFCNCYKFRR